MNENKTTPNELFLSFVSVALAKRKPILVACGVWGIGVSILAFSLSPSFKAEASFLPPESESSSLQSIGLMSLPIGLSNSSKPELVEEVFQSDDFGLILVDKFNLQSRYKYSGKINGRMRAVEELRKNISLSSNQSSTIGFSDIIAYHVGVADSRPDSAYYICSAIISGIDSILRDKATEKSHRKMAFLKGRIDSTTQSLEGAIRTLGRYQTSHNLYDLQRQTEVSSSMMGEILKTIASDSVGLEMSKLEDGPNSSRAKSLSSRIKIAKSHLTRLTSDTSNSLLPSLKRSASSFFDIERLIAEVKIQSEVLKMLRQQYEMERVESSRNYPILRIVSHPRVPEYKFRPKRIIVIAVGAILGWMAIFGGLFIYTLKPISAFRQALASVENRQAAL